MAPLLALPIKGIPFPYLITPRTDDEVSSGRATLIAVGDIEVIIQGIKQSAPERTDLIEKFEHLL